MSRPPAVAGRFYSGDSKSLTEEVRRHIKDAPEKTRVLGVLSPHAGFMYSGDVAGAVYSRIEIPDTVILLGPNHTGRGERVSVMTQGTWEMPQGNLEIDSELASAISRASSIARPDERAHHHEHSLETQLPFIQYFRKKFKIVPICFMRLDLKECEEISRAIVQAVKETGREVLVVASSDMTHYESHESASGKDRKAIDRILHLDAPGLYNTVRDNNISMCGVNPTTVMLMYARKMGAKEAELVKYMTSGEVSGDMQNVVGYAGVIVK
ncbi:MAG: AmmeMemoRadiSam system protein B [Nitrospinae bacterium]|nr:AmmeMemoRadiSam system protein B [Nitrospinota bacterium]